jgi:hypothetical protein
MFLALLRNDHCSFQQHFLRHFRCRRHKNCYSPKVRSGAHYAHAVVNLRDSAAVYEILIRKNDPNCARRGRKMREQSAKNKWLLASCLFCVRCATRWHASEWTCTPSAPLFMKRAFYCPGWTDAGQRDEKSYWRRTPTAVHSGSARSAPSGQSIWKSAARVSEREA